LPPPQKLILGQILSVLAKNIKVQNSQPFYYAFSYGQGLDLG
jgi:hypothetical protein